MSCTISLFDHIRQTVGGKEITVDLFLEFVREGKWQDHVLPLRTIVAKEERSNAKTKVPYVTMSGKFEERSIKGLIAHSGFICVDIDDVNPQRTKELICDDKHVYAAYTSIGGNGLAVLFKIDPTKHQEAFDGLEEYLYNTYDIIIDNSCRDVCRARYVSFDPDIYINHKARKFVYYVKRKAPTKIDKVVFAPGDFEDLINQVVDRGLNICESYGEWLRCGFALANKFGEDGRQYYHAISQFSAKYKREQADKQYDYCVKARNSGTTISTLYFYIKQAGIPLYSKQTQVIASSATAAWKGGRTAADTIENLRKFEDFTPEQTTDIVNQVFENKIEIKTEDSQFAKIKMWLRHNFDLRKNIITRYIESSGKPMYEEAFNDIYCKYRDIDEKVQHHDLIKIMRSPFVLEYNPLNEYFEKNKDMDNPGVIGDLWNTITTDNPNYLRYFGTKWLVSIIASAHGQHSPLLLVLAGGQNTGKTEFFRRLLPAALQPYYAESKLDAGKDDEILMCQKLLIMDDEMGGKGLKEEKRMKELLSKQTFSLREPYGRSNVDLRRLAVLCGTSNDKNLLSDPTGNRRIIPIQVYGINHEAYNAIDKDELFMAAYHLYKKGFKWQLTQDDIIELANNTGEFEHYSIEYELINKYFKIPEPGSTNVEKFTATEIKIELERLSLNQKLSLDRTGKELQRIGFKQNSEKINGKTKRLYVTERLQPLQPLQPGTPF